MDKPPRARVLIVDDDASLRATVALLLEKHGYEIREAPDALKGLRLLEGGGIDVVLLDLSMPGSSGGELLRHLRRSAAPPPVIVLSADATLDSRVRSLYGGASDYLRKPFEPEELLARLAAAMRQRLDLRQARAAASTDPLTGLANRDGFDRDLKREVRRALRSKRPLALLYFDVDGLKAVNDSLGHAAGDELLGIVARALRRAGRGGDTVARIGGDEFAGVLPETGRSGAASFIRRFRAALVGEKSPSALPVSASAGVAILGEDAVDAGGLRLEADRALYRDKAAGGTGPGRILNRRRRVEGAPNDRGGPRSRRRPWRALRQDRGNS